MGTQERRGTRGVMHSQPGFSLIELLVVVAIIGILLAMYSSTLTKAVRMAKGTATAEAMHQVQITEMTEPAVEFPTLDEARAAYRQRVDTGKHEALLTQLLFIVRTDREFDAYWHTLIDPAKTEEPQSERNGSLIAETEDGETIVLRPIGKGQHDGRGPYSVGWAYLSTVLSETSTGTLGAEVMYSDGHISYVRYPGKFPMMRIVAELSHEFVKLTE